METMNLTFEGGIAHIQLDRPEGANAMNLQFGEDIMAAAEECERQNPRAILISANGPLFCAGGDLKSFAAEGDRLPAALQELLDHLHGALIKFSKLNAPVIGAVEGSAAGAGFSLVMACDLVIASEKAKFTMAYTAAGLTPDGSSTYFLPRLVGQKRAAELMITNRPLKAAEALDWGLVNQVLPVEEVLPAAQKLAAKISSGPTGAYGTVKRLLMQTFENDYATQLDLEADGIVAAGRSRDGKEGIAAFLEKRKPEFTGE